MNLIVLPDRGSKAKPADYRGAFDPGARAFLAAHGGVRVEINQGMGATARFRRLVRAIEEHEPSCIAFFCHGLATALPQMGANLANLVELAKPIREATTAPLIVIYGCSTGSERCVTCEHPIHPAECEASRGSSRCDCARRDHGEAPGGDGGFADRLRDTLVKMGANGTTVLAHATPGRAVENPYLRRFHGPERKPDNVGGKWLVTPPEHGGDRRRWNAWRALLEGPFKFRFPFMTQDEIDAELPEAA